jgi:hypothetical protein
MRESQDSLSVRSFARRGKATSVVVWATVLAFCIGVLIYLALRPAPSPPELPSPPRPAKAERISTRARFFDEQVQPAIAAADKANREAAERCIQRLRDQFSKYRRGVEPLVEDLTSWGTRLGVVRRMPSDWWYESTNVQEFVTEKFQAHLFSEESLKQGIEGALATFRDDVRANSDKLLTEVKAAISRADLPETPSVEYSEFSSDVTKGLEQYSVKAGKDSVLSLVLTLLVSEIGERAAIQIVAAVGTRIAATAATASASAGGATAGGAVAGGAGGSSVGPVGTVVGAGVGLIVGVIIDWWISEYFEVKLSLQLQEMIDQIELSVIQGIGEQPGLELALAETCDVLRDEYQQSLFDRIVQESAP